MIQLFKPKIYDDSVARAAEVLKSGWLSVGPEVAKFEEEFAKYVGAKYAIALNSGTEALRISMALCQAPARNIITTPLTFVSTNHVILQAGYQPVFADIEPDTGNISKESIRRLLMQPNLQGTIGGIMVVHYGGQPVDLMEIYTMAAIYKIPVIEDAAHAFGATYMGQPIGSNAKFCCFSLHAVKPLTCGEGGVLTTEDEEIAAEAKKMRWLGITKSTADRHAESGYSWDYDVKYVGYKSNMGDVAAAVARGQLAHAPEDRKYRLELVNKYLSLLGKSKLCVPLAMKEKRTRAWHLMAVRIQGPHRANIMAELEKRGVSTGVHYKPNTRYSMYQNHIKDNGCKQAEYFGDTIMTLPLHLNMTIQDVETVCSALEEVENGYEVKR